MLNHDKSVFTPTQELQMLGFVLNSVHMNVTPNANNKEKLLNMCDDMRGTSYMQDKKLS